MNWVEIGLGMAGSWFLPAATGSRGAGCSPSEVFSKITNNGMNAAPAVLPDRCFILGLRASRKLAIVVPCNTGSYFTRPLKAGQCNALRFRGVGRRAKLGTRREKTSRTQSPDGWPWPPKKKGSTPSARNS